MLLAAGTGDDIDKSVMGVGFRDHGYGTTPSREKDYDISQASLRILFCLY